MLHTASIRWLLTVVSLPLTQRNTIFDITSLSFAWSSKRITVFRLLTKENSNHLPTINNCAHLIWPVSKWKPPDEVGSHGPARSITVFTNFFQFRQWYTDLLFHPPTALLYYASYQLTSYCLLSNRYQPLGHKPMSSPSFRGILGKLWPVYNSGT